MAVDLVVDEVEQRATDAAYSGDTHLAWADRVLDRLGAVGHGVIESLPGIGHLPGHGAGTGAVYASELGGMAARLGVEHEVDVLLLEQEYLLGAVLACLGEAHAVEQRTQLLDAFGGRCTVLDEFEAVGTDGVVLGDR